MIKLRIYFDTAKGISKEIYINPKNYKVLSVQQYNKNYSGGLILEVIFLVLKLNEKEVLYVESETVDSFLKKFGLNISDL